MIGRKITSAGEQSPATVSPSWMQVSDVADLVPTEAAAREIAFALNPRSRPRDPYAPGFLDFALAFLIDGRTPAAVRRAYEADLAERALRDEVLTDPRERLAFLTAPNKWAEKVAENYAPKVVEGGNTLMRPGYGQTMAPKVSMAGDTPVYQQGREVAYGPQKEPDYKDQIDAAIRQAGLALDQAKMKNEEAFREKSLAVDWFNAKTARINATKDRSPKNGSGLPAGYSLTPSR